MTLAYIDPATGAMVLQVIVAAVLGVGVFFRKFLLLPFALLFQKGRESGSDPSTVEDNKNS